MVGDLMLKPARLHQKKLRKHHSPRRRQFDVEEGRFNSLISCHSSAKLLPDPLVGEPEVPVAPEEPTMAQEVLFDDHVQELKLGPPDFFVTQTQTHTRWGGFVNVVVKRQPHADPVTEEQVKNSLEQWKDEWQMYDGGEPNSEDSPQIQCSFLPSAPLSFVLGHLFVAHNVISQTDSQGDPILDLEKPFIQLWSEGANLVVETPQIPPPAVPIVPPPVIPPPRRYVVVITPLQRPPTGKFYDFPPSSDLAMKLANSPGDPLYPFDHRFPVYRFILHTPWVAETATQQQPPAPLSPLSQHHLIDVVEGEKFPEETAQRVLSTLFPKGGKPLQQDTFSFSFAFVQMLVTFAHRHFHSTYPRLVRTSLDPVALTRSSGSHALPEASPSPSICTRPASVIRDPIYRPDALQPDETPEENEDYDDDERFAAALDDMGDDCVEEDEEIAADVHRCRREQQQPPSEDVLPSPSEYVDADLDDLPIPKTYSMCDGAYHGATRKQLLAERTRSLGKRAGPVRRPCADGSEDALCTCDSCRAAKAAAEEEEGDETLSRLDKGRSSRCSGSLSAAAAPGGSGVAVIGDLHGSISDLLSILAQTKPSFCPRVFWPELLEKAISDDDDDEAEGIEGEENEGCVGTEGECGGTSAPQDESATQLPSQDPADQDEVNDVIRHPEEPMVLDADLLEKDHKSDDDDDTHSVVDLEGPSSSPATPKMAAMGGMPEGVVLLSPTDSTHSSVDPIQSLLPSPAWKSDGEEEATDHHWNRSQRRRYARQIKKMKEKLQLSPLNSAPAPLAPASQPAPISEPLLPPPALLPLPFLAPGGPLPPYMHIRSPGLSPQLANRSPRSNFLLPLPVPLPLSPQPQRLTLEASPPLASSTAHIFSPSTPLLTRFQQSLTIPSPAAVTSPRVIHAKRPFSPTGPILPPRTPSRTPPFSLFTESPMPANALRDYVDRGTSSVEVVCLVLLLRLAYPHHVTILRGNHESALSSDFLEELRAKYPWDLPSTINILTEVKPVTRLYKRFLQLFDKLPISCVVGGVSTDDCRVKADRLLGMATPSPALAPDVVPSPLSVRTAVSSPVTCVASMSPQPPLSSPIPTPEDLAAAAAAAGGLDTMVIPESQLQYDALEPAQISLRPSIQQQDEMPPPPPPSIPSAPAQQQQQQHPASLARTKVDLVGRMAFICHGGACNQYTLTLRHIQRLPRTDIWTEGKSASSILSSKYIRQNALLWADPGGMDRGTGRPMFSEITTRRFLRENGDMTVMLRAHQNLVPCIQQNHMGLCLTVFSSSLAQPGSYVVLHKGSQALLPDQQDDCAGTQTTLLATDTPLFRPVDPIPYFPGDDHPTCPPEEPVCLPSVASASSLAEQHPLKKPRTADPSSPSADELYSRSNPADLPPPLLLAAAPLSPTANSLDIERLRQQARQKVLALEASDFLLIDI
ncbi:hypothetical protein PAPYR_2225 [Paratrimastix pyriformis]|uniref:Serine/threonine-protein phosphatase n=1 Tax=Paratrimastix pyriformis TaxID=342808 RepID=A0ABQ8UPV9_9EUKA|nr:hypothetical protein PAPYR_2225 [Paratrimastix pyriformis]